MFSLIMKLHLSSRKSYAYQCNVGVKDNSPRQGRRQVENSEVDRRRE